MGASRSKFSKRNVTGFDVDGDAIALTSNHPMATWLFRPTLDQTAAESGTDLPAVVQTGLGDYCGRGIRVPFDLGRL